jgi:simple sugar transport system ATP-binding protein
VPLDEPVAGLAVGLRQRVEILKALHRRADLLILDEPSAVLAPQEVAQLFELLARLRDRGKTVILVTHKLREIMAITDRVTVMRQGEVVHEAATRDTSPAELAEKMVGRAVSLAVVKSPARPGPVLLSVKNLTVTGAHGEPRVKRVSFDLRAGEIVGLAGVAGNGQSELLETLAGLRAPDEGELVFKGIDLLGGGGLGARARRRFGLAHVPEDRLRLGLVAVFEAQENAILGYHDRAVCTGAVFVKRAAVLADCRGKIARYDVRPPDPRLPASAFSGGNQQKLVLAREIDSGPDLLLVGQPTRGVDIGAIEFIHRRLVALRDAGKAVLLVSVELDEILGLSDRILVMAGGEITGEIAAADATEARLGLLMAGVREGAA